MTLNGIVAVILCYSTVYTTEFGSGANYVKVISSSETLMGIDGYR